MAIGLLTAYLPTIINPKKGTSSTFLLALSRSSSMLKLSSNLSFLSLEHLLRGDVDQVTSGAITIGLYTTGPSPTLDTVHVDVS